MVSKKRINDLEFDTIEEYFSYVVDSYHNGQTKQARGLYNELSGRQKQAFDEWFTTTYYYDCNDEGVNEYEMLHEFKVLMES